MWRSALPLTDEDAVAEATLCQAFERPGTLGITRAEFVPFWFPPPKPRTGGSPNRSITDPSLASMQNLGWEDEHIHRMQRAVEYRDDVRHRQAGATGWLIASPPFLQARDDLWRHWQELPVNHRPPLPLRRTPHLEQVQAEANRLHESKTTRFWRAFDGFCDEWRLQGMVTWDLPNVEGPKWGDDYPGKPVILPGVDVLDTPWHFPVKSSDGLGRLSQKRHRQIAIEHGFIDQSRWETYAQLLKIDVWERVMCSRYADRRRQKGNVTRMLAVLAELTGCDNGRVKKPRSVLRSFQRGKRTSLSRIR